MPPLVAAKIAGEPLFNDGVSVVVFIVIVGIITKSEVGDVALGFAAGWIIYRALRSADDHVVETLMKLALVTSVYALASALYLSGPIAAVVAGLLIGNRGGHRALSDHTRDNLLRFWELTDEMLNSVLFLLVGMEALLIGFNVTTATAGGIAIVAMLIGRSSAVLTVLGLLRRHAVFTPGAAPALIWAGLKG